ncbi:MAG TPA: DUF5652 family protein [Candidatus Paceibacterota bacterium]|nr:DUF5652 family protein [Candidatus Paceibacterota bacterium]
MNNPALVFPAQAIVGLLLWTLIWKCYSMWLAARRGDKWWFVALLFLNTLGILDMVYIFGIAKKSFGDMARSFSGLFKRSKQ